MPYTIEWVQKPYLMQLELQDRISEPELGTMIDEMLDFLTQIDDHKNMHLLINVTEMKSLPSLNVLRRELTRLHSHVDEDYAGMNLAYGLTPFSGFIMELLLKVTRARFKAFETRDEAVQFAWQMVEVQTQATRESTEDDPAGELA
jgi:hypothetical protein